MNARELFRHAYFSLTIVNTKTEHVSLVKEKKGV